MCCMKRSLPLIAAPGSSCAWEHVRVCGPQRLPLFMAEMSSMTGLAYPSWSRGRAGAFVGCLSRIGWQELWWPRVAVGGGWCFPSKYGGHLSGAHVSKLAAVVLRDGWTLHTLRHRFATSAYSAERDLLAVQRLLGHASVATTQRYAAPPEDALRRAVEAADIRKYLQ